jgi:hypothetical protein
VTFSIVVWRTCNSISLGQWTRQAGYQEHDWDPDETSLYIRCFSNPIHDDNLCHDMVCCANCFWLTDQTGMRWLWFLPQVLKIPRFLRETNWICFACSWRWQREDVEVKDSRSGCACEWSVHGWDIVQTYSIAVFIRTILLSNMFLLAMRRASARSCVDKVDLHSCMGILPLVCEG